MAIEKPSFLRVQLEKFRARIIFTGFLPAICILLSLACVYLYQEALNISVAHFDPSFFPNDVLKSTPLTDIPGGSRLAILYIGFFAFAEISFLLMALKEYMQDIIGVSDREIIAPEMSTPLLGGVKDRSRIIQQTINLLAL